MSCLWALLRAVSSCKMASSSVPAAANIAHQPSCVCHMIYTLLNSGHALPRWIHLFNPHNYSLQMCLLTVTQLKFLCSHVGDSLLSVRSSTQTAGISTPTRNPQSTLSLGNLSIACLNKHQLLTQAFHGLVDGLCIGIGIEIWAGFHSSSVGLQHARYGQKRIIFFCTFVQSCH